MREKKYEDKSGGDPDLCLSGERASTSWALLLFGLIGATATTIAVRRLRRTFELFYNELRSEQQNSSWRSSSYRRYYERMQELEEEERERVERIRQMQSVFHREARKQKKKYESWEDHGPSAYPRNQRDDWYWKTDSSFNYQRTNFGYAPKNTGSALMSHHYTVLGLDRSRAKPYSDAEVKTAFRSKAMEFHPDQNQENKEAAEAKFKEVLLSYEAIQLERKNGKCS